ncbi:MAG: hypothetical protein ACRD82_10510, partial [Blastocatellia bacterium]
VLWVLAFLVAVYGYDYFGHIIQLVVNPKFFLALFGSVAAFTVMAGLMTRFFWPGSDCPYAIIPR